MSSIVGVDFAAENAEKYAKILEEWIGKMGSVEGITESLQAQWGTDLQAALGNEIYEALLAEEALASWEDDVELPSRSTLEMFGKIAIKFALVYASADLLVRLHNSVKKNREFPIDSPVAGQIRFFRPSELVARAAQTLSQVFDMAKDSFNGVLNRFLQRKQELTGRRRWRNIGDNSRHSVLEGVVKGEGEPFSYKRTLIQGPRPAGGNPADWSNCSCFLEYETSRGKWIRV